MTLLVLHLLPFGEDVALRGDLGGELFDLSLAAEETELPTRAGECECDDPDGEPCLSCGGTREYR